MRRIFLAAALAWASGGLTAATARADDNTRTETTRSDDMPVYDEYDAPYIGEYDESYGGPYEFRHYDNAYGRRLRGGFGRNGYSPVFGPLWGSSAYQPAGPEVERTFARRFHRR